MLLLILFLTSGFFTGFAILNFFKIKLSIIPQLVCSLVVGLAVCNLLIFLTANKFGLNPQIIFSVSLILLVFTFLTSFKSLWQFTNLKKINFRKNLFEIIGLLFISFVIINVFTKSIFLTSVGIIAGNRLVWTDWPVHIAIASSFANGDNFPPQNPLYSGPIMTYPFFSDFLSSVLQVLGLGLKASFVIPGVILGLSSVLLIFYFIFFITEDKKTALLGTFIALFWGGIGFIYFFKDIIYSHSPLEVLFFPPHEYTFYEEKNLWFFSFIYSELLPQRGFLFGLPLFFISLILLIRGISHSKKGYLFLSAVLAGLLPFFHLHSQISFSIFAFTYIILALVPLKVVNVAKTDGLISKIFLYFVTPFLVLIAVQLPFFLLTGQNRSIGLHFGWMKTDENLFLFWIKNTGLFWPLILYAFWKLKINSTLKKVAIASFMLFLIPNLLRLASWPYDNLKVLTYWYFTSTPLVAMALKSLFKGNYLLKVVATIITITLTLSGTTEIIRILNTSKVQTPLWSKTDIQLAEQISQKTEPNSLILAAAVHDHPITALAGRKLIIGFPGNAWSWGFEDWSRRENDVRQALRGKGETNLILNHYGVDYVLISNREKIFEPLTNEGYFIDHFPLIESNDQYKLFKVK